MEDNRRGAEGVYARFLEQILDSLPTPIYVKDAQTRFVFSNRCHDEMIGKSDADLYSAEATKALMATDMNVISTSAIVSVVDTSENAELKRINDEVSRLNLELATNVQQLRDAQDALVKKGRMEQMGQLTATIAHELRNPMGAIRTAAFVMERKLRDKGMEVEQHLQRINNGIIRCDAIITQLLDFSRTKKIVAQPSDLDAWLENAVAEEAKRLPATITITCLLGLQGRHVPFDQDRMRRAIVNLMANAAEAMVGKGDVCLVPGIGAPHIEIKTSIDGEYAVICVNDNGPGMTAEVLAKVREPLFTTKSFGTGLGVPAIEQITVQHGGVLEITSQVGKGASFSLRLPLTVQSIEEAA